MDKNTHFARALAVTCLLSPTAVPLSPAAAQQSPPPAKQAPAKQAPAKASSEKAAPAQKQAEPAPQPAPPEFKETALTEKQVEGILASQKELDEIAAKIPAPKGNQPPKPNPKIIAQFEDVAKKNGFADYAEYNGAVETISVLLGGFDPKTKAYVGPEAVMKQQIAAVQADKKMPAKEKKAAVDEMNEMLKSPPPAIQNKGNIDLVAKYFDKLTATMQDNQ